MASLIAENWGTTLLMSLLEESKDEEYNEEQLNEVIQSLEAEIKDQNLLLEGDHGLAMDPAELLLSDEEEEEEEGYQNCLASMDFDLKQLIASSSSDEMNWFNYMDQCGLDFDDLVQNEIVSGGYSEKIYNIFSEIEHQEHGFSSL